MAGASLKGAQITLPGSFKTYKVDEVRKFPIGFFIGGLKCFHRWILKKNAELQDIHTEDFTFTLIAKLRFQSFLTYRRDLWSHYVWLWLGEHIVFEESWTKFGSRGDRMWSCHSDAKIRKPCIFMSKLKCNLMVLWYWESYLIVNSLTFLFPLKMKVLLGLNT